MNFAKSFGLLPLGIINKLESYYSRSSQRIAILTYTGFTYTLFAFGFLYYKNKVLAIRKEYFALGVFHVYSMFLFLLFSGIDIVADRTINMFSNPSLPFLLPIPLFFIKGTNRILFTFVLLFFCILKFYSGLGDMAPYQNLLFL